MTIDSFTAAPTADTLHCWALDEQLKQTVLTNPVLASAFSVAAAAREAGSYMMISAEGSDRLVKRAFLESENLAHPRDSPSLTENHAARPLQLHRQERHHRNVRSGLPPCEATAAGRVSRRRGGDSSPGPRPRRRHRQFRPSWPAAQEPCQFSQRRHGR